MVAVANGVDDDELCSGRVGERAEEGERSGESKRGPRGCVASPRGVQASRWSGKQEVAGRVAARTGHTPDVLLSRGR